MAIESLEEFMQQSGRVVSRGKNYIELERFDGKRALVGTGEDECYFLPFEYRAYTDLHFVSAIENFREALKKNES